MVRSTAWGQRVAWAKQFFDMIPPPHAESTSSSSSPSTAASSSAGPTALPPGKMSDKAKAKQLKKLEYDPLTAWRCRRCGWMEEDDQHGAARKGALPRNPATGRPAFTRLADHLEWVAIADSEQQANPVTGSPSSSCGPPPPPCCTAGRLAYDRAAHTSPDGAVSTSSGLSSTADEPLEGPTPAGVTPGHESASSPDPASATRALLQGFMNPIDNHPPKSNGAAPGTPESVVAARMRDPARVILVLDNPKTPRNIGSILRALGCFAYAAGSASSSAIDTAAPHCMILFTGQRLLTALRYNPLAKAGTDTQGIRDAVGLYHLRDYNLLWEIIDELRQTQGKQRTAARVHVTAVDLIAGAYDLSLYVHPFLSSSVPASPAKGGAERAPTSTVVYILGPEDGTLPAACLPHCDDAVYIPTVGSLNLSAAITVLLYDRTAKRLQLSQQGERQSRRRSRSDGEWVGGGSTSVAGREKERQREEEMEPSCGTGRHRKQARLGAPSSLELEQAVMQLRNPNNKLEWSSSAGQTCGPQQPADLEEEHTRLRNRQDEVGLITDIIFLCSGPRSVLLTCVFTVWHHLLFFSLSISLSESTNKLAGTPGSGEAYAPSSSMFRRAPLALKWFREGRPDYGRAKQRREVLERHRLESSAVPPPVEPTPAAAALLYRQLLRKGYQDLIVTDKEYFRRMVRQEFEVTARRTSARVRGIMFEKGQWLLENKLGGLV
eukprot:gene8939-6271_t